MFGSKKRQQQQAERAIRRFYTGSTLLQAVIRGDKDTMAALVSGVGTDDDSVHYTLRTFIMVAHTHPEILATFRETMLEVPVSYLPAFESTIEAARAGNPNLFYGVSVPAQGVALMALANAIVSGEDEVLVDAMMMLEAGA